MNLVAGVHTRQWHLSCTRRKCGRCLWKSRPSLVCAQGHPYPLVDKSIQDIKGENEFKEEISNVSGRFTSQVSRMSPALARGRISAVLIMTSCTTRWPSDADATSFAPVAGTFPASCECWSQSVEENKFILLFGLRFFADSPPNQS